MTHQQEGLAKGIGMCVEYNASGDGNQDLRAFGAGRLHVDAAIGQVHGARAERKIHFAHILSNVLQARHGDGGVGRVLRVRKGRLFVVELVQLLLVLRNSLVIVFDKSAARRRVGLGGRGGAGRGKGQPRCKKARGRGGGGAGVGWGAWLATYLRATTSAGYFFFSAIWIQCWTAASGREAGVGAAGATTAPRSSAPL